VDGGGAQVKHRDFSPEYPADPERGMRAALNYAVMTAGKPAKELAAECDVRPSDFSRMLQLIPDEDANHRRAMPPGTIIRICLLTGNWSPLATFCGYLGLDPERLDALRRDPAAIHQQVREIAENVRRISVQLGMFGVQARPIKRRRAQGA
jgi:hypothetical protein